MPATLQTNGTVYCHGVARWAPRTGLVVVGYQWQRATTQWLARQQSWGH